VAERLPRRLRSGWTMVSVGAPKRVSRRSSLFLRGDSAEFLRDNAMLRGSALPVPATPQSRIGASAPAINGQPHLRRSRASLRLYV
jgi:hypothetical protein